MCRVCHGAKEGPSLHPSLPLASQQLIWMVVWQPCQQPGMPFQVVLALVLAQVQAAVHRLSISRKGPHARSTHPLPSLCLTCTPGPWPCTSLSFPTCSHSTTKFATRPCLGFRRPNAGPNGETGPYEWMSYKETAERVAQVHAG